MHVGRPTSTHHNSMVKLSENESRLAVKYLLPVVTAVAQSPYIPADLQNKAIGALLEVSTLRVQSLQLRPKVVGECMLAAQPARITTVWSN